MTIELNCIEVENIIKAHIEKLFPMPEGHKILKVEGGNVYGTTKITIGIPVQPRAPKAAPPEPPDILTAPVERSEVEEIF